MRLCLFEDTSAHSLLPLTYFRPVYELRCGMLSLRERIERHLNISATLLHSRPYLRSLVRESSTLAAKTGRSKERTVLVNGRTIMTRNLAARIKSSREAKCFMAGETPVAVVLNNDDQLGRLLDVDTVDAGQFADLPVTAVDVPVVSRPWDLVYANETTMLEDFALMNGSASRRGAQGNVHRSAVLVNRRNIRVGKNADVGAGVVLDANSGPVVICAGAKIFPNAVIIGPSFVGPGSLVKIGAQIYGNTSIGARCKVGGELEDTIIHSYANKQHDGFLGHSYLCPWVNLGAGTTSSDLKNTYGTIRVSIGGTSLDTGRMFVGLFAGDHAKTGINVTLNTGTILGPCANVFGTEMPPKEVRPFSWGTGKGFEPYQVEKALLVAETVMRRRGIEMTEAYRTVFRTVHEMSTHDRSDSRT